MNSRAHVSGANEAAGSVTRGMSAYAVAIFLQLPTVRT